MYSSTPGYCMVSPCKPIAPGTHRYYFLPLAPIIFHYQSLQVRSNTLGYRLVSPCDPYVLLSIGILISLAQFVCHYQSLQVSSSTSGYFLVFPCDPTAPDTHRYYFLPLVPIYKYPRVLSCFPVRTPCPCLGRGRKCPLDLDLKRLITSCYCSLHWHNGAIICKAVTLPHKLHYFPLFFASALLFRYWSFAGKIPWNIINLFSWI